DGAFRGRLGCVRNGYGSLISYTAAAAFHAYPWSDGNSLPSGTVDRSPQSWSVCAAVRFLPSIAIRCRHIWTLPGDRSQFPVKPALSELFRLDFRIKTPQGAVTSMGRAFFAHVVR